MLPFWRRQKGTSYSAGYRFLEGKIDGYNETFEVVSRGETEGLQGVQQAVPARAFRIGRLHGQDLGQERHLCASLQAWHDQQTGDDRLACRIRRQRRGGARQGWRIQAQTSRRRESNRQAHSTRRADTRRRRRTVV